jgi:hypothetical protein
VTRGEVVAERKKFTLADKSTTTPMRSALVLVEAAEILQ